MRPGREAPSRAQYRAALGIVTPSANLMVERVTAAVLADFPERRPALVVGGGAVGTGIAYQARMTDPDPPTNPIPWSLGGTDAALRGIRVPLVVGGIDSDRLYPLHYAMFDDASPGPVKYALSRVHPWLNDTLRLPLVPCNEHARKAVDAALEHAGLV